MSERQRANSRHGGRRYERRAPSAGDLHRQWLELVDTDGPFLAVPALTRVYAAGIPQPDADAVAALKDAKSAFEKAWEAWDRERDAPLDRYRTARDAWVQIVLRDVLGWASAFDPATATAVRSPDHSVTVNATGALTHGDVTGALVLVVDPVDSLRDPLTDGWATSPIDRMEELLRAASVPVGVVTDGRWWAIVSARPETMVASGVVDAQTWVEEPATRNAFVELLSRRRLVAGRAEDRLTELFKASVAAAEEITEALGVQVRRAVELLVQALSEAALDARDRGEPDPLPADRTQVYEAAVTVLMRVVFLLFAEERGLLPQGRLFAAGYGISAARARRPRRPRAAGGLRGARRHAPDLAPAARHLARPVPRRLVRGPAAALLRRFAVRPGPVRVPHRAQRERAARGHGQRPGAAGGAARGAGGPAQGPARPADLLPRHRRRADRLHLRGPARLLLRRRRRGDGRADRQARRGARADPRRAAVPGRAAPRPGEAGRRDPGRGQDEPARRVTRVEVGADQGHPDQRRDRGRRPRAAGGDHVAGPA